MPDTLLDMTFQDKDLWAMQIESFIYRHEECRQGIMN